jgi:hypothetical protein
MSEMSIGNGNLIVNLISRFISLIYASLSGVQSFDPMGLLDKKIGFVVGQVNDTYFEMKVVIMIRRVEMLGN